MQYDSDEERKQWIKKKYPSRVRPIYFSDIPHRDNKIVNFFVNKLNGVSRRFNVRQMIPNIYAGWNWFSWHRKVAEFIISYEHDNPKYFQRFYFTNCADELIFHTLLHNQIKRLNIVTNNSLRYVNWKKKVIGRGTNNSPLILNEDEYEDIVKSHAFFCRKIDPVISSNLKVKIKEELINQDK